MEHDYYTGLSHYHSGEYEHALNYFNNALNRTSKIDPYYTLCISFYGLTLIYLGDYELGIAKCIQATEEEITNSEIFYNLAIAARVKHDRKLSLKAIRDGLNIDRKNKKLIRLRNVLGQRRKPKVNFLARDNFINIFLGKITYQTNQ